MFIQFWLEAGALEIEDIADAVTNSQARVLTCPKGTYQLSDRGTFTVEVLSEDPQAPLDVKALLEVLGCRIAPLVSLGTK